MALENERNPKSSFQEILSFHWKTDIYKDMHEKV
jgi:hypothetical protein